ncbi:SfnB family sulfur acquisition oxidoreductase [Pseudomonas sp. B21-036]|jgi:SfnB family sulfur acquisition oxidoreductase|uniref:SfnB family sulfur acquisition oxidoreductase n=1 Tax=Pseudomonas sp. B21-036 TaxID=2895485 RepID=UPI00215F1999|nr:SfnB family sulfur acquisition oxidoreductase [Pseudomonas sp. B21-036]UVL53638.1 SfnB family sulfur acquisition oxidoreductase [Pseudomonas sp. B21-036]
MNMVSEFEDNQHHASKTVIIRSDQQALETAHALAEQIAEGASLRDANRTLPRAEMNLISRSGLLAITIPKDHGGADVSANTLAKVGVLLSEADSSIGQIPQNHLYSIETLRLVGTAKQREFFYRRILQGARLGNAVAETGTPTSTAKHRKTRLIETADGLHIQGKKAYCTGALMSDWIAVFVKDAQDYQHMAYVPVDAKGLTLYDDWDAMGQRSTGSGTALFDDVPVLAEHVLPFQRIFDEPSRLGPFAQLWHTSIQVGIARAALKDLKCFVTTKARPWIDSGAERASDDVLSLFDAGALQVDLHAAEALLEEAAYRVEDLKSNAPAEALATASVAVAQAKVLATELALKASSKLVELAGAQSSLAQYNLDRHWRNARTHTLHDPVRWKFATLGDYYLNDKLPPRRGYI